MKLNTIISKWQAARETHESLSMLATYYNHKKYENNDMNWKQKIKIK